MFSKKQIILNWALVVLGVAWLIYACVSGQINYIWTLYKTVFGAGWKLLKYELVPTALVLIFAVTWWFDEP